MGELQSEDVNIQSDFTLKSWANDEYFFVSCGYRSIHAAKKKKTGLTFTVDRPIFKSPSFHP